MFPYVIHTYSYFYSAQMPCNIRITVTLFTKLNINFDKHQVFTILWHHFSDFYENTPCFSYWDDIFAKTTMNYVSWQTRRHKDTEK